MPAGMAPDGLAGDTQVRYGEMELTKRTYEEPSAPGWAYPGRGRVRGKPSAPGRTVSRPGGPRGSSAGRATAGSTIG